MKRSDFINKLASRLPDMPPSDVDQSARLLLDLISSTLAAGNRCEIRGFGTFSLHVRKARMGRNPQTGEQVPIPEKRTPHFKPSKLLREQVTQSRTDTPIQEQPSTKQS